MKNKQNDETNIPDSRETLAVTGTAGSRAIRGFTADTGEIGGRRVKGNSKDAQKTSKISGAKQTKFIFKEQSRKKYKDYEIVRQVQYPSSFNQNFKNIENVTDTALMGQMDSIRTYFKSLDNFVNRRKQKGFKLNFRRCSSAH